MQLRPDPAKKINKKGVRGNFREGNGNPFQYFCLENPMDGGAWWASPWGQRELDTNEQLTYFHITAPNHIRMQYNTMLDT